MPISQGVLPGSGYVDPASAGGALAVGVTLNREQLVAMPSAIPASQLTALLLADIRQELMLLNDNLFPNVDFTIERSGYVPPDSIT